MRLWNKVTDLLVTRYFRVSRDATAKVETSIGTVTDLSPSLLAGLRYTEEDSITAHAGGGQTSAYAFADAPTVVHRVTTVATAADSVALPAATGSGQVHIVINDAAANSMQLFGTGTDTIDGIAHATGVAVAAGKRRWCLDFASGKWISLLSA